jgi:hypothetical protein
MGGLRVAPCEVMARSSRSIRALALGLGLGLGVFSSASATADEVERAPGAPAGVGARERLTLPPRCAPFAEISVARSSDRPDSERAWRQLLSLAACVQDGSLGAAGAPDQLAPMVDDLSLRLAMPMLIYVNALEHADAPIQLRAAFHIGMAYVALSTRARSSIAAPPDPADDASASRHGELHARLEPLLAAARRAAWVAFHAIDEAAAADGAFAANAVERNMVCAARQMLPALRDAAPERILYVPRPGCEGARVIEAAR